MSSFGDGLAAARAQEVAAVDLGSNSFHMLVARARGDEIQVIDRLRDSTRLAAGLDEARCLSPQAQERALACLERFGQRLRHIPPAQVRAVGTNTMREMQGGEAFLSAAEAALGHEIEIISGVEEARLVFGGVTHGLDGAQSRCLVVDIGGGSTELIIGRDNEPKLMESVSLGCVVHTQRFFADGSINKRNFNAARLAARVELEFLEKAYRDAGWDLALGASGTVRGVWRVMRAQKWAEDEITVEGLEKTVELLLKTGKISKIDFDGLREDRRPVFAGGLAVLAGVFDSLGIERLRTSDRALREGLVYDLLGRLSDHDVRAESVATMGRRFGIDAQHAQAVAETASEALSQVAASWKLDSKECRSLLGWAASLHEIGLSIAHSSYHKHGEYMLRHADLHGFSQTDQRLLAALVRLHRGKIAVALFDELPAQWREPLRRLTVILRLAYLLNRSRMHEQRPRFVLTAGRRSLALRCPRGWLERHPLTRADIEREQELLKAIDFKLSVD